VKTEKRAPTRGRFAVLAMARKAYRRRSYNKWDHGWTVSWCLYRPWHLKPARAYTDLCRASSIHSGNWTIRPMHRPARMTAKCTLRSRYISIMRRFRSERFSFPVHTRRNRRWSRDAEIEMCGGLRGGRGRHRSSGRVSRRSVDWLCGYIYGCHCIAVELAVLLHVVHDNA